VIKVYNAEECQPVKPSGLSCAQLEARNLSLSDLMWALEKIDGENRPIAREALTRLAIASHIASRLEDSLFYARMFKDTCEEGRIRRIDMIDSAVDHISVFRNGGLYP
jgi:hypothetical protein